MMPTGKGNRRGMEEKSRRGKLSQRASSFHGARSALMAEDDQMMIRPRTVPDLLRGMRDQRGASNEVMPLKLTKLLLNVTIQRCLGPVQVLISPESTVGDLIVATVQQYLKEGRRPLLTSIDGSAYDLHYSQFSLECLDRDEKLIALGSRNFFLCTKRFPVAAADGGSVVRCSEEVGIPAKNIPPWLKLMDFFSYNKGV